MNDSSTFRRDEESPKERDPDMQGSEEQGQQRPDEQAADEQNPDDRVADDPVPDEQVSPDEQVLGEFALEIERQGVDGVDLADWIQRHPHLETRLRGNLQTARRLDESRPVSEPPLPERLGEFRIVRRIAQGGMGDIFEAIQEPLGRRVAVKTIRQGRLSPELGERFLQEQKVLASLHQTHIVPIHTAGQEGDLQYFAMPYIEGAALHNVVSILGELQSHHPDSRAPRLGDLALIATAETGVNDKETLTRIGSLRLSSAAPNPVVAPTGPRRLSVDYIRSVARVMADVADAVQHAHEKGILHRDIKPSNIMVDTREACWIIDFGLARYIREASDDVPSDSTASSADAGLTASGGLPGTPHYMAPEQFDGRPDVRSDVWSLGATLYELLTLQRPFLGKNPGEIRRLVQQSSPARPQGLARPLPPDLAAICLKALQKDPARRYSEVAAFAEDLRRFLRDEPTIAHRIRAPRRAWKWAKRNKGWTTALVVSTCATFGVAIAITIFQHNQAVSAGERAKAASERAQAEGERAQAEGERAKAERQRADEAVLSNLLQQALYKQFAAHHHNWSRDAWGLVEKAARISPDGKTRMQAVPLLSGTDAIPIHEMDGKIMSVAFAPDRPELLVNVGGDTPATLSWERGELDASNVSAAGIGRIQFTDDGTAWQLSAGSENRSLVLHDLTRNMAPRTLMWTVEDPNLQSLKTNQSDLPIAALSADGTVVAADIATPEPSGGQADADATGHVVIWDKASGKTTASFPCRATAIALSPDGKLLAASRDDGSIPIWSMPDGKLVQALASRRHTNHVIAFGRNPRRSLHPRNESGPLSRWLLASGDSSGTVVIWDPAVGIPLNYCRGSPNDIHAIAFHPDGVTLVSAGRGHPRLWDIMTGTELLRLADVNWVTSAAFSADGNLLAIGSKSAFQNAGKVTVWELERDRGIAELRGLSSAVYRAAYSPDGRFLAALAHDWTIGVWELPLQRLLHVIEVQRGFTIENAGFAFDRAGQRMAFSTRDRALLWDLESGGLLQEWPLPPGLQDQLAFDAQGRLLSFRVETQSAFAAPLSNVPPADDPRVIRLRELAIDGTSRLVSVIPDFDRYVYLAGAAPDGAYFFAEGISSRAGEPRRSLRVFDATGKRRYLLASTSLIESGSIYLDPTGKLMTYRTGDGTLLLEMPTGVAVSPIPDRGLTAISPGARYYADSPLSNGHVALHAFRPADRELVGSLSGEPTGHVQFSPDGKKLAWCTSDGVVRVCDIPALYERLTSVGLGW